jgi:hypothetical protein
MHVVDPGDRDLRGATPDAAAAVEQHLESEPFQMRHDVARVVVAERGEKNPSAGCTAARRASSAGRMLVSVNGPRSAARKSPVSTQRSTSAPATLRRIASARPGAASKCGSATCRMR